MQGALINEHNFNKSIQLNGEKLQELLRQLCQDPCMVSMAHITPMLFKSIDVLVARLCFVSLLNEHMISTSTFTGKQSVSEVADVCVHNAVSDFSIFLFYFEVFNPRK